MRKALDLKPLSFSDVMSRGFSLYVSHFVGYARWFGLFWLLPMMVISSLLYLALDPYDWVGHPAKTQPGILEASRYSAYFWLVKFTGILLAFTLGASGVYFLTARLYAGASPGLAEVARAVFSRLGQVTGIGILHTFVVLAVTSFCWFVPVVLWNLGNEGEAILIGMLLYTAWPLVMMWYYGVWGLNAPVVVLDDATAAEAWGRSAFLTKGWRMRLIGVVTTAAIVAGAPGIPGMLSIPGVLLANLVAAELGYYLAQMVTLAWAAMLLPLFFVPVVVFYFDMRCRRESYDLAVMALNFGIEEGELARYRFNPNLGYYPKDWKGERGRRRQSVRKPAPRDPVRRHQQSGMQVAPPQPFGPQPGMTGGWPPQPPPQQWPQQPPQQQWPPPPPPPPNQWPQQPPPPPYPPRRL